MPANTLDSDCCAAIPTKTLVSAPPRTSWPIGMPSRPSVMISVVIAPIRRSAYRTIAACAVPMAGSSTDLALPASPMVAALASAQNATASPIAMICIRDVFAGEESMEAVVRPAGGGRRADRQDQRDDRLPGPCLGLHLGHLCGQVNLRPVRQVHRPDPTGLRLLGRWDRASSRGTYHAGVGIAGDCVVRRSAACRPAAGSCRRCRPRRPPRRCTRRRVRSARRCSRRPGRCRRCS